MPLKETEIVPGKKYFIWQLPDNIPFQHNGSKYHCITYTTISLVHTTKRDCWNRTAWKLENIPGTVKVLVPRETKFLNFQE